MAGIDAVAEIRLPSPMTPASLIGVGHLFEEGVLVELRSHGDSGVEKAVQSSVPSDGGTVSTEVLYVPEVRVRR